ncbi:MAG: DUF1289 domain-containing protein [Methyloceanibacter sp.]|nr:DUF1289 domain-containing protein [Methyloceanibacter sp.]
MTTASPCVGTCKLDDTTGWCLGCGRSGTEIADWRDGTAAWRNAIWSEIPERLEHLGVSGRRLPWAKEDMQDFVVESLKRGSGTWVMGVVGAVAEFSPATGRSVAVEVGNETVTAHTDGGALSMWIDDDVRAMTFDPPSTPLEQTRVVLAVKRERGRLLATDRITDLGEDARPLVDENPTQLFDLGLGRKEARFCVRVASGPALSALQSAAGETLIQSLPRLGSVLTAENPTRVIETTLGRIEVQSPIPSPGGRSPDGPHTHLLLEQLEWSRAMPVGMDLPRAYLPGALFYPRP